MRQFLFIIFCSLFILSTVVMLYASSTGITGLTRKSGGVGCTCHGTSPSPNVSVNISGPDTVTADQKVTYTLTITGGPLIRGGVDIAVTRGVIDTLLLQGLRKSGGELTHRLPKAPSGGAVNFQFRYTAPGTIGRDTLWSVGNSVDFTGGTSGDLWNHSPEKIITVINPTGIISNSIPTEYNLSQNYPNPFNPATKIRFALTKSSFAKLVVYNALGSEVETLVSEPLNADTYEANWNADKYSSGVYYYKLIAGDFVKTRKMVLIK